MTDTNHTQEKEAIEDALNRVLTGGRVSITQKGQWVTHDDGSITPPAYTVTFTPSKAPPVSPPPPPSASGFQYVRGLAVIPPTYPATDPAQGSTWTDPVTGCALTRVTDQSKVAGSAGGLRNVYSRYTCENANGKYLLVMNLGSPAAWIFDRVTMQLLHPVLDSLGKPIGEPNELHWDYTDPDALFYVRGMQLWRQQVSSGVNTLVRDFAKDFPGASLIMNDVEGDSSHDSRYWCFMAKVTPAQGSFYPIAIFTYDAQTNAIPGTLTAGTLGVPAGDTTGAGRMPTPNMVEVSPDGRFALIDWNRCWGTGTDPNKAYNGNLAGTHVDGPHVYPLTLDTSKATKVGIDATHSAWAMDAGGKWLFVSQNNRNDWIEAADPDTGTVVQIINQQSLGWSTGYHFCGADGMRGWVLISTYANIDTEPGDNQIMLLPLVANGNPLRVCPSYNLHIDPNAYFKEGSAAMSRDGLRVYWPASFHGTQPVDVVRADLPADWQAVQP